MTELFISQFENLSELQKQIIREMSDADLIDFTQSWTYADIVFVVESRRLYANKMILGLWSPVFEAMFKDNFKEKNATEITLPDKKYEDVLEMLKVLHPPCKDIAGDVVPQLLPLAEEYQMDRITRRCEDALTSEASSVKNFLLAKRFNLSRLEETNLSYMRRCPVSKLRKQKEFAQLEAELVLEILTDKCERFETHLDSLRDVRMTLERKKPTTFPGIHILCDSCTSAREQQVDCQSCMKNCCSKITEILRSLDR